MYTALDICGRGGSLCVMSHLYGLDTSFIYEMICKKELQASFPLRNGDRRNIESAINYIDNYWAESDNNMLGIFNNVEDAFIHKSSTIYNKQIIKLGEITRS